MGQQPAHLRDHAHDQREDRRQGRLDGRHHDDLAGPAPDVGHRPENPSRADHRARADAQAHQVVAGRHADRILEVLATDQQVGRLVLRVLLALGPAPARDLAPVRLVIDQHARQLLPA